MGLVDDEVFVNFEVKILDVVVGSEDDDAVVSKSSAMSQ